MMSNSFNNRFQRINIIAKLDFNKRYYNDRLGIFWALLNPLFRVSIYYFVFKNIFEVKIENYGLFIFCGLIVWMFFTEVSKKGLRVFRSKKYLLETIQVNKLDLFYIVILSVSFSLTFNLIIFKILVLILGLGININILFLPLILISLALYALSASFVLSTLMLFVEDIIHLWDLILLFGFWTSGIFFRGTIFLEQYPFIIFFNPLIGIIKNTREVLLYNEIPDFKLLGFNIIYSTILCFISYMFMRKFSNKAVEIK